MLEVSSPTPDPDEPLPLITASPEQLQSGHMPTDTNSLESKSSVQPNHSATIYRRDYRKPDFLIPNIKLQVDILEDYTRVHSTLEVRRNYGIDSAAPFVLNGEKQKLVSVAINGRILEAHEYTLTDHNLTIKTVPNSFCAEIISECQPNKNQAGIGLYKSGPILCTQMEAEGFRLLTYFPDRPDVMSRYTTSISADSAMFPVLLSNGDLVSDFSNQQGRRTVVWRDPFPKPAYLFALVAGDLALVEDSYTKLSGHNVKIQVFVDKGNEDRCAHAIDSLKEAMRWDERVFGLEYDLDTYMIVAVDYFNMGAMENKGLNIFNSSAVLVSKETATDQDALNVKGIIAHEYFHNWTGNRVTLRDWFQLTLKEGLTVYRDQEFTADTWSRSVKRIFDARDIREWQFLEDAGPNSHPIRPDSYSEIDNFYTSTVYEKGAEVIRMLHSLIGDVAFKQGMRRYFELFDGKAVTCDDFVHAMELGSGRDLSQFLRWYSTPGTPRLSVTDHYDPQAQSYEITIKQSSKSPGDQPLHIPFVMGLLDPNGRELALNCPGEKEQLVGSRLFELTETQHTFKFTGIAQPPTPSLLRGFSAPVHLDYSYTEPQLILMMSHDSDPYNRYEASSRLALGTLRSIVSSIQTGQECKISDTFISAFRRILNDRTLDPSLVAEIFNLPSLDTILEDSAYLDFDAAHTAREKLRAAMAAALKDDLLAAYNAAAKELGTSYKLDPRSIGVRALKNTALQYLCKLGDAEFYQMALEQFSTSGNMTESIGALECLTHIDCPERELALAAYYDRWHHDYLAMNKWFSVQAASQLPTCLSSVAQLEDNIYFDIKNPNKAKSLIRTFANNKPRFHDPSGAGYKYVADKIIEIDSFNPHVAAALATTFQQFGRLDAARQSAAREELERICSTPQISKGVLEIVGNILKIKS